jgi:hypothetical protein
LNIIFTKTLRKMDFDFNKMTACDEPFYRVVPGKTAYPIGRVCLPVTFGTKENFRIEYLTFEVADFRSSYHAILGQPMLAKFMTIPHHTYLIMKMSAPNGILSILGDIMVSYNCESTTVKLSKDYAVNAAATVMVAQAAKIDQSTLEVPEQKHTNTALDPSPAVKKVFLGLEGGPLLQELSFCPLARAPLLAKLLLHRGKRRAFSCKSALSFSAS